jgi:general secretion pathway protein G
MSYSRIASYAGAEGPSRLNRVVELAKWSMKTPRLVFICALLATSCGDSAAQMRPVAAEVQIHFIEVALNYFAEDCGRYPSSAEGLKALISRPAGIPEARWRGPYLKASIPKDPWGKDYMYFCPSSRSTNFFDLFSCGQDGLSKTGGDDPDDVNVRKLTRNYD